MGALVVRGEYRSGTIRGTLTACPRRSTVLAVKATVCAATVFAVALAAATGAYLTGSALLAEQCHPPGDAGGLGGLSGWATFWLLCAYTTAALVIGAGVLTARDS